MKRKSCEPLVEAINAALEKHAGNDRIVAIMTLTGCLATEIANARCFELRRYLLQHVLTLLPEIVEEAARMIEREEIEPEEISEASESVH